MDLRLISRGDPQKCDDCDLSAIVRLRAPKHCGPHDGGDWCFCLGCLGRRLLLWRWTGAAAS